MSEQLKELKPYTHPENGESYLFAFEDYLNDDELKDLWEQAIWFWKNYSHSDLGDFSDDVIDIIAREMGLRRPAPESALEEDLISHLHYIAFKEQENMRHRMELGYDPDENPQPLPLNILKIGRT